MGKARLAVQSLPCADCGGAVVVRVHGRGSLRSRARRAFLAHLVRRHEDMTDRDRMLAADRVLKRARL